jgi:hypothetical protein
LTEIGHWTFLSFSQRFKVYITVGSEIARFLFRIKNGVDSLKTSELL